MHAGRFTFLRVDHVIKHVIVVDRQFISRASIQTCKRAYAPEIQHYQSTRGPMDNYSFIYIPCPIGSPFGPATATKCEVKIEVLAPVNQGHSQQIRSRITCTWKTIIHSNIHAMFHKRIHKQVVCSKQSGCTRVQSSDVTRLAHDTGQPNEAVKGNKHKCCDSQKQIQYHTNMENSHYQHSSISRTDAQRRDYYETHKVVTGQAATKNYTNCCCDHLQTCMPALFFTTEWMHH